jgi:hypothetical protein
MSFEQATKDLRTHFHDNWSKTPISWPNVEFEPPNPPDDFIKFNTQDGSSTKLEVGKSGMSSYPGVLFLGINVPAGSGRGQVKKYQDDIRDIFEFESIGIVNVREFQPSVIGKSEDGNWWQENANFGFEWLERPN